MYVTEDIFMSEYLLT